MIRLGIIGYGHRMTVFMTDAIPAAGVPYQVVGVVDPAEKFIRERLANWGVADQKDVPFFSDLPTLVRQAKPDALLIGTGCSLHTPYAIEAAKYDLPLFLEKPVAVNLKQAQALEKAFRKTKCEVVVSFPLRVSPACTKVRELIEADTVGHPEHVTGLNYVPYGTVYYGSGSYQSLQGLFVQKATHDLDYMMYLMNSPITRVGAMGTYGRVFGGKKPARLMCSKCDEAETCPESPQSRARNGTALGKNRDHACLFSIDVGTRETGMCEDSSSCVVEFASGAHGVYTQVFYSRRDAARRGAIVSGYKGTVSFDWYKDEINIVHHHRPVSDKISLNGGKSHFGGDHALARNFFELIQGKVKRSRTPIEAGLASIYACLAAKQSAETGKFMKVRQVNL